MRSIGLVVHGGRPSAVAAARIMRDWAHRHGVEVVDVDVWEFDPVPSGKPADVPPAEPGGRPAGALPRVRARRGGRAAGRAGAGSDRVDLIVTVGGDGTFLRGARVAVSMDAPILGVNVGRVGFLTEAEPGDVSAALDAFAEERAETEQRLTLTMRASRPLEIPEGLAPLLRYGPGSRLPQPVRPPGTATGAGWPPAGDVTAINDVVFERLTRDRQAGLAVYLDAKLFASYSADALIVATATGSTAYSFAAGGPVLSPRLSGLVFTPVAPHMVFNRSLVLAADEVVAVRILDQSGQVAVSVDGQLRGVLDPGDWMAVYAGPSRVRLVRLHPADFYGRLRQRFALTDAPAAREENRPTGQNRPGPGVPVPPDIQRLFRAE